jgi:hypothetical protein
MNATQLLYGRLAIALIGIVIWGYALKYDDAPLRVVGMVLIALSLLMRFLRRFIRDETPESPESPET